MSERRHAAGPLADYAIGMRVMTKEGFPGSIDDIHEGPADLTTYYVTLDAGQGGGMYAEAEIWPLNEVASSKPVTSTVEVTAADDYPELGSILTDRLPPEIRQTLAHVASLQPKAAAVPLKCVDCGDTYFTDQMHDPHHEDCQKVNGEILSTSSLTCSCGASAEPDGDGRFVCTNGHLFDPPSNEEDGHSVCANCGSDDINFDSERCRQCGSGHIKQGFYLPLDNSAKDQKFSNPDEQRGWQDGVNDGKSGVTRNMQDPSNVAYRAGYDRGWAYGVEVYRAPVNGFDLGDFQTIEQMQTVDPPTNRLGSQGGQEDLPFFEAGQLWDLVKGTPVDPEDPFLKGHLTYDWCRYRMDGHCYYSKTLDVAASEQAGYSVWTPEDRGPCYRNAWEAQQKCPIALPGPHVPGGFTDATKTWESGGQHNGVPTNVIRQDASISTEASLPAGYALQYVKGGNLDNYAVVATFEGKAVGAIQWKPEREVKGGQWNADHTALESVMIKRPPQIVDLKVNKAHQRKGLATAMYEEAKQHEPNLVHDDIVLPDGEAWMKTLAMAEHDMTIEHGDGKHRFVCPSCGTEGRWLKSEDDVRDRAWAHALAEHDGDWDDTVNYHEASKTAVDIPALPEQAIANQFSQYPVTGPEGVSYFKGEINDEWYVDCLLYYKGGALVGVLNHYPMDMGPERKGNVLLMVLPDYRGKGIGKALWDEAKKRWNVTAEGQDQTPSGKSFTDHVGSLDPSLAFMLTATWKEVQQKAKRIRSEGGVRIIASKDGVVVAHVRGDTNVYETEVVRGHSKHGVSHWTCGCKWAAYSWGRSGPWKKYEGRMCSHALALQYEAQSRSMFGRELTLDESQPEWMDSTVPVRTPNSYDRDKGKYSSLRPVTAQADDDSPLRRQAVVVPSFPAKVWGKIVRLFIEDGSVKDVATGAIVAVKDVLFPGYDPVAGLRYVDPEGVHTSTRKTASPMDDIVHAKSLDDAADDLLEAAHDVEPQITPLLTSIAATEGGKMAGLDHRFKTKSSLLRKMQAEANLYPTPGECARNMSDPLRYTMVLPADVYSETASEVLDHLTGKGYKKRVKNFWLRGDDYNGINVALTSPEGVPVEVQFHTDSSLSAKKGTHPLYEQWRTSSDPAQRKTLAQQMVMLADTAPIPPGVHMLTPFKRKPNAYATLRATLAAVLAPERTAYRYLLVHDAEDAPLAVLRVDNSDGDVARWLDSEWIEALEYGRYNYLGEPRSEEISEDEAEHYCDVLTLNPYATASLNPPKEAAMSAEEWGILSDLHDAPEPALPSTDGADEDEGQTWSGYAGDPEPDPHHGSVTMPESVGGNGPEATYKEAEASGTTDWLMGIDVSGADQAALAVAAALAGAAVAVAPAEDLQAMAEANIRSGGNPGDRDIMAAAQAGLQAEAVKTYSQSERQQIIAEGEGGEAAGNLDRLDLSGTHYEALEASRATTASLSESEDLGWDSMGDPNGDL